MIDLYFEAPDDDGEPTLWNAAGLDEADAYPVLRRCDLRCSDREYHWRKIVAALEAS